MSNFPVRFSNPATREHLRVIAEELGISMNRLAEEAIERELATLSLGLETEMHATIGRLRALRAIDIEASLDAWAAAEGQADPITASLRVATEDPLGIAAAFDR